MVERWGIDGDYVRNEFYCIDDTREDIFHNYKTKL